MHFKNGVKSTVYYGYTTSLRDVAPVYPHHVSSELLSEVSNDATDDEAVPQYEYRSSSNDEPA